jgi:arylsulfatase A-like enzyme
MHSCWAVMRALIASLVGSLLFPWPDASGAKPNLLYITVDDMRPQLPGSFGHDDVHAPAIASLTKQGTTFARAYCQQAVCSPSR